MIKTITLSGQEIKVDDLGGFNTIVHNLSDGAVYASKYPNIEAGADNVAEVPAGAAKLISTTNGTIYLLGAGKAELTGQDHDSVNFRQPSSPGGGGGTSDVTKAYVSAQDALNLEAAKKYTNDTLDAVRESIEEVRAEADEKTSVNAADMSALQTEKADRSEIPTTLPANGGNADTVNGHTVNADVPEDAKFTDTTYGAVTQSANGLMLADDKKKLDGIAASANNYTHPTTSGSKHIPSGGSSGQILRWSSDGTAAWGSDNNTYSNMTGATASAAGKSGLVPVPAAGKQASFLRGDGTWTVPTNTTYANMTGATEAAAGKAGLVPTPPAGSLQRYLSAGGDWDNPASAIPITIAGTNLNTYTTSGIYFFANAYAPSNPPVGTNGWLLVLSCGANSIKQIWFRFGTLNSNDFNTYVRTKNGDNWSDWKRFATVPAAVTPWQIVSIVQGTRSGLTGNQGTYYVPYNSNAEAALIEVWQTVAVSSQVSRSYYGSRYLTGLSSAMTAITSATVINSAEFTVTIGADATGRITLGGSIAENTNYRVTWFC